MRTQASRLRDRPGFSFGDIRIPSWRGSATGAHRGRRGRVGAEIAEKAADAMIVVIASRRGNAEPFVRGVVEAVIVPGVMDDLADQDEERDHRQP